MAIAISGSGGSLLMIDIFFIEIAAAEEVSI